MIEFLHSTLYETMVLLILDNQYKQLYLISLMIALLLKDI